MNLLDCLESEQVMNLRTNLFHCYRKLPSVNIVLTHGYAQITVVPRNKLFHCILLYVDIAIFSLGLMGLEFESWLIKGD